MNDMTTETKPEADELTDDMMLKMFDEMDIKRGRIPGKTRVGACATMDDTTCYLVGYGTYAGMKMSPYGIFNPRIDLDDGSVAWGCEVWWGEEERFTDKIKDKTKVMVKIVRDDKGNYARVEPPIPEDNPHK